MKDSAWTRLTTGFWPNITRRSWPLVKRNLQRSKLPILTGPFRGEVGFEALYWVPFLKALQIDPARLIPITRGGAHCWYPAKQGVELFGLRTARQVRVENLRVQNTTGMLKQFSVTPFDHAVIQDAAKALNLDRYLVLHPSWMYHLLAPFWDTQRGFAWLSQHCAYAPFAPPPLPDGLTLPEKFMAVRFYHRATWPQAETTTAVGHGILTHLADQMPVVVLNSGIHADEHTDLVPPIHPNIITINGMTPQNNLAVQSAILSRAQGFIGTYGGFAQLGLMYKKPTISFYTEWRETAVAHRHLTDLLGLQFHVLTSMLKLTDLVNLQQQIPRLAFTPSGSSGQGNPSPETPTPEPATMSA